MPIHPSTLRHVLSLAIPYIPRQAPVAATTSTAGAKGRRSLHAFSRKRLGKGLNADHLIGRLRHPPREPGGHSSKWELRGPQGGDARRSGWDERLRASSPSRDLRSTPRRWAEDRPRPYEENSPAYRRVGYITDMIDFVYKPGGSKELVARTKRYISHLDPSYLSALPTAQLVYEMEDLRTISHRLDLAADDWRKAPWGLHAALRHVWSGLARTLDELDQRGEAENLMEPEEFDGILQSLMIYHPRTTSTRTSRPNDARRSRGEAEAQASHTTGGNEEHFGLDTARPDSPIDQFTTLTVPIIFHLVSLTGHLPTPRQLLQLARSTSLTVLPSIPHAQAQRTWAAVTHLDIARASDTVWTRRRDMMDSILGLWPGFAEERLYEEEIIQGMDECDILLHGNLAAMSNEEVERLRGGVAYWTNKRAAIYARKRAGVEERMALRQRVQAGEGGHQAGWKPNIALGRDIAWLIRDSLVAFKLRHRSTAADINMTPAISSDIKSRGVKNALSDSPVVSAVNYENPLDLFRLLLTVLVGPKPPLSYVSPGAIKIIVSCIIRLRNAFFHNHNLDSLQSVIHILGIPPASSGSTAPTSALALQRMVHALHLPPLPSEVHATLLCAAHDPTPISRVRQLLVALHHLPVPSTPLRLGSYTRKYLNYVARECDAEKRYTRSDPSSPFIYGHADDDIRDRHRVGGWRSVLQGLYVKWGEGYSLEEWELRQRVIQADRGGPAVTQEERSHLKAIKRKVAEQLMAEDHRVVMTGKGENILTRPKVRAGQR